MHCVAQDKRLPLHYATERGATLEEVVVKLLLGPEGSAKATATAADKVRRALPTPPLALPSLHLGPTHVLPVLCPPPSLPLLLGALAEAFPRAPRHV